MKKLFIVLVAVLCLGSCQRTNAQVTPGAAAMTVSDGATLSGADTSYLSATINGKREVTISATVTYTSGTLAGDGRLFLTADGSNYELYSNTDTMAISSPITFAGKTQVTKTWRIPINYWKGYMVRLRTSTGAGVPSGYYIAR